MNNHKNKSRLKFLLLIAGLFLISFIGKYLHIDIQHIQESLFGFSKIYGAILYVALFIIITFFILFSKDKIKWQWLKKL